MYNDLSLSRTVRCLAECAMIWVWIRQFTSGMRYDMSLSQTVQLSSRMHNGLSLSQIVRLSIYRMRDDLSLSQTVRCLARFQGFKVLLSILPLGTRKRSYIRTRYSFFFFFFFVVVFRYWLNQNNPRIQLINLASLTFLDFDVIFMRLQNLGTLGWCAECTMVWVWLVEGCFTSTETVGF